MAEYIERDALMELYDMGKELEKYAEVLSVPIPVIRQNIKDIPTIDAVPVVRCKDCKHRDGTLGQPNILCGQMHDDDYCSYGERKVNNND